MTGDMAEAVAAARTAGAHLSQAAAALKRLSTALECPLQPPLKGPDIIAAHRREHGTGTGPNRDPQSTDISQYQPIPAMTGYRQTI